MGHIGREGQYSPLHAKSKSFAVDIVKLVKQFNDWRIGSLFQQVLKSGTSIHANVKESEFAQSQADFITKLSISLKEANETKGWLEVLYESECIPEASFNYLYPRCKELLAMLVASVKTAKTNKDMIK